jgi:hypothetical protein
MEELHFCHRYICSVCTWVGRSCVVGDEVVVVAVGGGVVVLLVGSQWSSLVSLSLFSLSLSLSLCLSRCQ